LGLFGIKGLQVSTGNSCATAAGKKGEARRVKREGEKGKMLNVKLLVFNAIPRFLFNNHHFQCLINIIQRSELEVKLNLSVFQKNLKKGQRGKGTKAQRGGVRQRRRNRFKKKRKMRKNVRKKPKTRANIPGRTKNELRWWGT
jgi:hypothetical protein